MRLRSIYLTLCVAGTLLPLWRLLPFFEEHGLDLRLFVQQLLSTPVGSFFGIDVVVSSVVLWVFVFSEGRRLNIHHLWAPIVANLAVGVSLGFPLFLVMRETRLATLNKESN